MSIIPEDIHCPPPEAVKDAADYPTAYLLTFLFEDEDDEDDEEKRRTERPELYLLSNMQKIFEWPDGRLCSFGSPFCQSSTPFSRPAHRHDVLRHPANSQTVSSTGFEICFNFPRFEL